MTQAAPSSCSCPGPPFQAASACSIFGSDPVLRTASIPVVHPGGARVVSRQVLLSLPAALLVARLPLSSPPAVSGSPARGSYLLVEILTEIPSLVPRHLLTSSWSSWACYSTRVVTLFNCVSNADVILFSNSALPRLFCPERHLFTVSVLLGRRLSSFPCHLHDPLSCPQCNYSRH
jgi:hypothetical protein